MEKHVAQEGKTFVRKADGYRMGNILYMGDYLDGTPDVIENYEEIDDQNYVPPTDGDSRKR